MHTLVWKPGALGQGADAEHAGKGAPLSLGRGSAFVPDGEGSSSCERRAEGASLSSRLSPADVQVARAEICDHQPMALCNDTLLHHSETGDVFMTSQCA